MPMRLGLLLVLSLCATGAFANGVMGVALEQYDPTAWWVYVIVTVAFEAWALGGWLVMPAWKSLVTSIFANFSTAFCCANLGGIVLHSALVGSPVNPNPLLNMFVVFLGFGILSGLVESFFWMVAKRGPVPKGGSILLRTLVVHAVGIPLGLAIMLVPSRPYPFLEGYVRRARFNQFSRPIAECLSDRIRERGEIPNYASETDLLEGCAGYGPESMRAELWTFLYRPSYSRFATGDSRNVPAYRWNASLTGLKVPNSKRSGKAWLLEPVQGGRGLVVDFDTGEVLVGRL